MVFTRRYARFSAALSIVAITLSLVCSLYLFIRHGHLESPVQYTGRWLVSGDIIVPFGFLVDPTSVLMLAVVAVICFLVQVYSLGYMAGDPGFSISFGSW
jgi:NADH-quinone oxidoreductase subunit L